MKNKVLLFLICFVAMIAGIYSAIFYSWQLALLGLGGLLGFVYLLNYPLHGVAASVFLAGLGVLSFFQVGPIHIKLYQIVMLFTLAVSLAKYFVRRDSSFFSRPLFFVLGLLFLTLMLSFLNASYPAVFVKQFLLIGVYMLFFITICSTVRVERHLHLIEKTIIFSGVVACLYSFLVIAHILPAVGGSSLYHFARPQSFFAEPNEFGVFLVFVAGFVVSRFLAAENTRQKIWAGAVLLMIIANIIPNMSRGSWLGLSVSVLSTMVLLHSFNIKKITLLKISQYAIIIIGIILVSLHLMTEFIPSRSALQVKEIVRERAISLFQQKDPTRDIRYQSNKTALAAFWEHPFIGWGLGNAFVILEKKYTYKIGTPQELPRIIAATSSNFISDVAMETGIFGLAAFFIFIFWTLKNAYLKMKKIRQKEILIISIGALASFSGMLVNGLTYAMHMLPYFWITAGILVTELEECNEYD